MRDAKEITFDGDQITICELTVKQVRSVFSRMENTDPVFLDDLLDQPVPALIIAEATGIQVEKLDNYKPSILEKLAKEVEAVNPFVASLIKRRLAMYEKMKSMTLDQPLTGQPAG